MEFKDLQTKEVEQTEIKQPETDISVDQSAQELAQMFEIDKKDKVDDIKGKLIEA